MLRPRDLLVLGLGATVGTGVFVLTGVAVAQAGPGALFSLVLAGSAAAMVALLYAELAALIPVTGGAYAYASVAFGKLVAWLIGWNLVLYYTLVPAAVAIGWSGHMVLLLAAVNTGRLPLPGPPGQLGPIAAVLLIFALVGVVARGMRVSARLTSVLLVAKLGVLVMFVAVALPGTTLANWHPFLPFGWRSVLEGAAILFFAFMGFDALCMAAEECESPQRDLPVAILASVSICLLLYVLVTCAVIGGVPPIRYDVLGKQPAPLAFTLRTIGHPLAAMLLSAGAVAGMATVAVVLLTGQSRLLLALGRDGLLPSPFGRIHPATGTPLAAIMLGGTASAIAAAMLPLTFLVEVANLAMLLTFGVMTIGVWVLRRRHPKMPRSFRTPFLPLLVPGALASLLALILNLPLAAWKGICLWVTVGLLIYAAYGCRHGPCGAGSDPPDPPSDKGAR